MNKNTIKMQKVIAGIFTFSSLLYFIINLFYILLFILMFITSLDPKMSTKPILYFKQKWRTNTYFINSVVLTPNFQTKLKFDHLILNDSIVTFSLNIREWKLQIIYKFLINVSILHLLSTRNNYFKKWYFMCYSKFYAPFFKR